MIIVFCGVPASGKSTIVEKLVEHIQDVNLIVSDDISSPKYEKIMKKVDENIGVYKYTIIDATFFKKEWRDALKETVRNREEVVLIYVHCNLETCLKRNRQRENAIPEEAIYTIWNKFDVPSEPDLTLDTDVLSPDEAVELILKKIQSQ
jgi:tRNA uridine 5-carbamoylmethylation protein Kti12